MDVDLDEILVIETNNKEFACQELRAVCTITKQNYSVRVAVCSTMPGVLSNKVVFSVCDMCLVTLQAHLHKH